MPQREVVSQKKLLELLNRGLARHDECEQCEFMGSIDKLPEPLPDGGNWNRSLAVRGRPRDPQACGETAADVVFEVAAHYNLE